MGTQPSRKPVFPPHIAPYIDVAAYMLDSRAPAATLYLDRSLAGKELLLLTRAGQAEPGVTGRWQRYLAAARYKCIVIDSLSGQGFGSVLDYFARMLERKQSLASSRGVQGAVLRVVALGVPNVGKSTFLNRLLGGKTLKTGDRPGITRGYQWARLFEDVELLDTPGVLRDPAQLNRRKPYWMLLNLLPYDSSLREEALELLIANLTPLAWKKAALRYRLPAGYRAEEPLGWLECIANQAKKAADDEGGVDWAARRVIHDFQQGVFGRLSLETPEEARITSPLFSAPEEPQNPGGE